MNLTQLRQSRQLLFEGISGSRAYGLDLPGSDTDYRGVFILPKKQFYGLNYTEQISSPTNDEVFYELRRFGDLLAKNNAFRGGAISPGVDLRLRSLHEFTDKLPLVQREGHISILGYDTETSIRSGVINGMVAEIEGMIEFYEGQYGKINAVLTGGDAPFFESRMKKKIFADTNFLFKGLYAILEQQK